MQNPRLRRGIFILDAGPFVCHPAQSRRKERPCEETIAYANKKIEELDTRRQTISKAIAELSVETMSPQKEQELSYYLDHWDSIEFDDKRKAADGLIISISATSDHVQVEWKI